MSPRVCSIFLLSAIASCAFAAEKAAEPPLPARPFHVERTDGRRWDVTFTVAHEPFHGAVFYAVPPNDPCQTVESVELFALTKKGRVDAVRTTDAGPFKKPLLKLAVQALAPFTVTAHVVVQFHRTSLAAGMPAGPVPAPGAVFGREVLDDGWPNEKARAFFHGWMKSHQLIRAAGEGDGAFAFRVLKFMRDHFKYVIPDAIPAHKAAVAKDPEMGDWRYTLGTSTGECWRLSDTYVRVMRMNSVPARLVSGNFINEQDGHHLRSLVWLSAVGWVPVEVTSSVSAPKKPALDFFGTWGGPMLVGNRNIGYELPGPKGSWSIGTFDQLGFADTDGKWDFPAAKIKATILPAAN